MPKITAYKCPFTKKIFESRSGYRRHLLKLRKTRTEVRIERRTRRQARERVDAMTSKIRSVSELESFIVKHFNDILLAFYGPKHKYINDVKMHWFKFERCYYSDMVSNTHSCPRSGVTNWGGRIEGAPRGYPGFSGQMKWEVTGPKQADYGRDFNSHVEVGRVLEYIGVHTGSGCPGWKGDIGFQVFADDFPGIKEEIAGAYDEAKKVFFRERLKNPQASKKDILTRCLDPISTPTEKIFLFNRKT